MWMEYNKSHDIEWLLRMIEENKKAAEEDLEKEEDQYGLAAYWEKGYIQALKGISELIRLGMIKENEDVDSV